MIIYLLLFDKYSLKFSKMKNIYLSVIKNFMYLCLVMTIVYMIILVMVGYINYDNRFIGCEGGQCSVLFSFGDEEDQKEAAIVNDKDSDRAYTNVKAADIKVSSKEVVKVADPIMVSLFILVELLIALLLVFIIRIINRIIKHGVFYENVAASIEKLIKGFIGLLIIKSIVTAYKSIHYDSSFSIGFDSDTFFNLFVILIVLFMAEVVRRGASLRSENDLTI